MVNTYGSTARGRRIADEDLVEKGALRQGVAPVLARVKPARGLRRTVHAPNQVVGKADLLGALKGARTAVTAGFKAGAAQRGGAIGAAAKPRMGLGASVQAAKSPAIGRIGQAGMWAGANPGKAGLAAGGLGTAAVLAGNGQRNQAMAPVPPLAPLYGGFGKRSYDPEGERRFRQGAAGAATGVGAVGAGAYAARETRDATRVARRGAAFGPHAGNLRVIELENGAGNKIKAKLVNQRAVHVADRLKRGGLATSRSGALAGAGALGLAGVSGALFRNRNEPRWD